MVADAAGQAFMVVTKRKGALSDGAPRAFDAQSLCCRRSDYSFTRPIDPSEPQCCLSAHGPTKHCYKGKRWPVLLLGAVERRAQTCALVVLLLRG